jgi:MFS family permease
MLRALRHRNYRLFFVGQLISLIGTWMQSVAMGWLVYRLTGSEGLLGLVAASTSLPVLIFSLSGGALADQVPKKRVLLTTQSTAMLLALTIALLTFTNVVQVWHIIVLAMLQGMVNAFDAPARQAFAIEMVGREDLLNAIALNSSLFNIARTAGPALAGVIVALVGEAPAFLFNGLSFLAIIICLLLMRLPPFEPPQRSRQRDQLRESLGYIVQEPTVRTLLLIAGSISLFGLAYFPLLPAFARDVLQTDARGFGLLSASSGAGALVAALSLAQFSDHMSRGRLLIGALLLFPLFLVGFTLMRSLLPAMLMITLVGWSGVTSLALTNTLIQSIVPDALRARVMSVFTMQLMGLGPFGALGAGVVAQWVGSVPLVMACCAAIAWFIVLGNVVLVPRLWQL